MRRINRLSLYLLFGLVITVFPFSVLAMEKTESEKAQYLTKDEVVYATLTEDGKAEDVYVVNVFDITKPGIVVDYGSYSKVTNLTDLAVIEQKQDEINIPVEKGRFYYQGDLDNTLLPWEFTVTYFLDGKEVSPQQLTGETGEVEIRINVSATADIDPVFFENYTLQISMPFDTERFSNIHAEEGLIANVGKEQQVTFTLMPEKEAEFSVTAAVDDFSFDGIEIVGVPLTMAIDRPDIDEMAEEMDSLSGAVTKIHEGVMELHQGVAELNEGAHTLQNGSSAFQDGLTKLAQSSAPLITGSEKINVALKEIDSAIMDEADFDIRDIMKLADGLSEIAKGLRDAASGLEEFQRDYGVAFAALDEAITEIPSSIITEEQIQALYASGADKKMIDKLVETYDAAQKVKDTYGEAREGLSSANKVFGQTSNTLKQMASHLEEISQGLHVAQEKVASLEKLPELFAGLEQMASEYATFHAGLLAYANGVEQLQHSYTDLHQGVRALATGTDELESGTATLEHGTRKLQKATEDLPEQLTQEIDAMIAAYDTSDFDAVSFVSSKNEKVEVVQFVIKTAEIKLDSSEKDAEPIKEKRGFWTLLKELFTKK